jgi:hypothetical protein
MPMFSVMEDLDDTASEVIVAKISVTQKILNYIKGANPMPVTVPVSPAQEKDDNVHDGPNQAPMVNPFGDDPACNNRPHPTERLPRRQSLVEWEAQNQMNTGIQSVKVNQMQATARRHSVKLLRGTMGNSVVFENPEEEEPSVSEKDNLDEIDADMWGMFDIKEVKKPEEYDPPTMEQPIIVERPIITQRVRGIQEPSMTVQKEDLRTPPGSSHSLEILTQIKPTPMLPATPPPEEKAETLPEEKAETLPDNWEPDWEMLDDRALED